MPLFKNLNRIAKSGIRNRKQKIFKHIFEFWKSLTLRLKLCRNAFQSRLSYFYTRSLLVSSFTNLKLLLRNSQLSRALRGYLIMTTKFKVFSNWRRLYEYFHTMKLKIARLISICEEYVLHSAWRYLRVSTKRSYESILFKSLKRNAFRIWQKSFIAVRHRRSLVLKRSFSYWKVIISTTKTKKVLFLKRRSAAATVSRRFDF